jgi:hypothetical protein
VTGRPAALALLLCAPAALASDVFSVPACQRPAKDEYVFGLSGAAGDDTDDFGRDNLAALSDGAGGVSLFAARPSTASTREYPVVFQNPLAAAAVLERLAGRPERDARIILTGHGAPNGVYLGVGSDDGERRLGHEAFFASVTKARKAGKRIRADFLSCFSGGFMPALMPGKGLAPACGLASTVPEKKAEGCYQDGSDAERNDYAASAAALDDCRPGRDWRAVHAAVFERLKGNDIPMLSSDYFLLYGPGAERLGRAARAPYPGRTLIQKKLGGGLLVYLDLINARVVAARGPGGRLPAPGISIVDCPATVADGDTLGDGEHRAGFFLHRSVADTAWPAPDCVPTVRLDWPGRRSVVVEMSAVSGDASWDPRRSGADDQFRRDLSAAEREAPLDGLKPGARLLLARLLPAFDESQGGRELADKLKALAVEVEAADPIRGASMRVLLTAMWVKEGLKEGVSDGTRFHGRWLRTYLTELFNETETKTENLDYSRLAFMAATAIAERDLRNDPGAKSLVADLDALRACEKTLR